MKSIANKENIEPLPAVKNEDVAPLLTTVLTPTKHYKTNNRGENVPPPNDTSRVERIDFSAPRITYSPRHQRRDSEGSREMTGSIFPKGIAPNALNKRRRNHTPKSRSPASAPLPPLSSPISKENITTAQKPNIFDDNKNNDDDDDDEKTPTSDPAFKEKTWLEELFEYYDFTDIRAEFCAAATEGLRKQALEGDENGEGGEGNDILVDVTREEDQKLLDEEHFLDTEYDF